MNISSFADVTRYHARLRPDEIAMEFVNDGRTWTFSQLDNDVNRVAQALKADDVGSQDRVAILDKNSPEYMLFLFGVAKLDAVSVAINWRLAAPEMEYILNDSEATVLVIGQEYLSLLKEIEVEHIQKVIVCGDPGDSDFLSWEQWLSDKPPRDPGDHVDPNNTCFQYYSSGTTGLPKGVEITHNNFLHLVGPATGLLGVDQKSVCLVAMPFFHITGSGWGMAAFFNGGRAVLLREPDMPLIVKVVPEKGITHTVFPPSVLQFLMATPGAKEADWSSLQAIIYGASPITESVLIEAISLFGCGFYQLYGSTETSGFVTLLSADDHDPEGPRAGLLRSCGKPILNHEVCVMDPETLQPVNEGEVGEIWAKGPQIMKGYWKNPEANQAAFVENWFRTGDAGYQADGYIYIHDRVKDMIISGGENIYPAEIENVLMKHEDISDAAVIGVPSDRWGETVKAVISRSNAELSEQEVINYCRTQLAGYKCPTSVDWIEELPRNPTGKVLKTELRKPYWKDKNRNVS